MHPVAETNCVKAFKNDELISTAIIFVSHLADQFFQSCYRFSWVPYLLKQDFLHTECPSTNSVQTTKGRLNSEACKTEFFNGSFNHLIQQITWMAVTRITGPLQYILYFMYGIHGIICSCSQLDREKSPILCRQKYSAISQNSLPYMSAPPLGTGKVGRVVNSSCCFCGFVDFLSTK